MKRKVIALLITLMLVIALGVPAAFANRSTPPDTVNVNQTGDRSECSEDLTGETFIYYSYGDLSGPYSFISQPLLAGLQDAAAYFNENGGICGASIELLIEDTGGDLDRGQEFWDDFTSRDNPPVTVGLFGSGDAELVRDQAVDLQTPILLSAGSELALYGENGDEPAYTFAIIPLYTDQLGNFCNYISENWDAMGMEGDPVIGHLSWEGAFGRSSDTENTQAYCESLGVGYAGAEYFLPTTSDVSTQLNVLVENGANIIYTTSLATGPANISAAIAGAEMQGQIILAGPNWVLDTSVIGLAGADSAGIIGSMPYLWWDELENLGVQVVSNSWAVTRYLPAGDDPDAQRSALATRNIAYLLSFPSMDLWIELMIHAINDVGYENLNGQAVYEVLTNDFEYNAMGGILNVAFDETNRAVPNSRIGQIQFIQSGDGVLPTVAPLNDFMNVPDLKVNGADVVE